MSALLFAIIISPLRPYCVRAVVAVASPLWYAGSLGVDSVMSLTDGLRSKKNLARENERMTSEIAMLRGRLNYLDILVNENNDLRQLLTGVRDTIYSSTTDNMICLPTPQAIGASVMSAPDRSYYSTMIINVGSSDNVAVGDLVYSFADIALGYIADLYKTQSRVVLYSAAGLTSNVYLGPENYSVVIRGDGGGTFVADLPKSIQVNRGDNAVLQSDRTVLVAKVAEVGGGEDNPLIRVYLQGPINLNNLRWVYVDRTSENVSDNNQCIDVLY